MERKKGKTQGLVVLLLFGVFAVSILSVLLTGADAYRRLAERDRRSYDDRTAGQYLSTRVRQADRLGYVTVRDFEGADALVFTEEIEGEIYETLVYCHDGWLRELFSAAESGLLPEDGEKVLEARSLDLTREGQLLTALVSDPEGREQELKLYLRSREEAVS